MAEMQDIDDNGLVARIVKGDHQAFAQIVERHSAMFYRAAYRNVQNEQQAEDVVQDAFLKLWDRPQAFDPAKGVQFTTWFYRVVTNAAIDALRKSKSGSHVGDGQSVLDMVCDDAPPVDEHIIEHEKSLRLERAIARLPVRQRAALNLCVYEGLSNKEAAQVLGVGVKALESLLMRRKKTLKDDLHR